MLLDENGISREYIKRKIYFIRGVHVMLDKDIAAFYDVKPIRLREQVQRNIERFPEDFMFQLNDREVDFLLSQNAIPSRKYLGGSMPYVFSEQGIAGLSGVLRNSRAAEIHVMIMRAFVDMRQFIQSNTHFFLRLCEVEKRQLSFELESEKKFEQVFRTLESGVTSKQGIFYDAYVFVCELIREAHSTLVLIDNYIDESVLTLFSKRRKGVLAEIYTKSISRQLELDLKKYNEQYPSITVKVLKKAHDRFLIIDHKYIYHFGASLKDLGKKWFAFSRFDSGAIEMILKLREWKKL